jgi:hypothetical protein
LVKQPTMEIDLDKVNHTELVRLCHWMGIPANRGIPREVLVQMLENFEDIGAPNPIDVAREIVSQFLRRYWDRIRMQAQMKVCPDCTLCRDMQVLECFNMNKKSLRGQ